jgi:hypothetical protein
MPGVNAHRLLRSSYFCHGRVIKLREGLLLTGTRLLGPGREPDEMGSLEKSGPGHFLWVPQNGPSFVDRQLGTPLSGGWTLAIQGGKVERLHFTCRRDNRALRVRLVERKSKLKTRFILCRTM